jgi:Glycosyltransferase family 87
MSDTRSSQEKVVILTMIAATALKIAWAACSAGTIDAVLFYNFARAVRASGLCAVYVATPLFNHTPLTAAFASALYAVSGGQFMLFAFLLRLTCALADIALLASLLFVRRGTGNPPWWSLILFAASPVSIMVSGFHGNVDPVMTLFLFAAALACANDRVIWSGLFFGLACNVKIVPIAMAPVFFFFWTERRSGWSFAITSGLMIVLGSLWPLLQCPVTYLSNVFGYGSYWGVWGIPYWLRQFGGADMQKIDFKSLSAAQVLVSGLLKAVIVTGVTVLGWRRRGKEPAAIFSTLAMAWVIFFVFAPGTAVQYMVWPAPFLLLLSARWYATITAAASFYMIVFYQTTSVNGSFPWFFVKPMEPQTPVWSASTNPLWLVLIALFCFRIFPALAGEAFWTKKCTVAG